jgi:L,D-transpeptidase YcbB
LVRGHVASSHLIGLLTGAIAVGALGGCKGADGLDRGNALPAMDALVGQPLTGGARGDSIIAALESFAAEGAVEHVRLLSGIQLKAWYVHRGYTPTWTHAGELARAAAVLGELAGEASELGQRRTEFDGHRAKLEAVLTATVPASVTSLAAVDALTTDLFLTLASRAAIGTVWAADLHRGWSTPPRDFDGHDALSAAVGSGDFAGEVARAQPQDPAYQRLAAALRTYRGLEAAGGWPRLEPARRLEAGDSGTAVADLAKRLQLEGFLSGVSGAVFDAELDRAVRNFQRSRGLEPDGIVGPLTRSALEVPAGELADRIAVNLERLRWEDRRTPGPHISVEIPAFELYVVEAGDLRLEMRVIAGRPDWPTPVFDARVTQAIFSPYWNVPPGIIAREVIPAMRRDPGYLARNHLRIFTQAGVEVSPAGIDWHAVQAANFPYRIRQDPGPLNPLGGVKFMLPNPHHVFLHDTPGRAAFARADRALSHGCVRVENPVDLAAFLLADPARWSRGQIEAAMSTGVERTFTLPRSVPISIRYRTAWVASDGVIHFRDDIYGHDGRLRAALAGTAVPAASEAGGACDV